MTDDFRDSLPHLAAFWPYHLLLREESDRGKVLISAGFIEEQLKNVLLGFMLDVGQAAELVASPNAPLGTFSARISTCYVLGLISEDEHHDLNIIRRIRNDFAHHIHTNFKTQSVVDRCKQLRLRAYDYKIGELPKVVVDPPSQFVTAAVAIIMNLINRPHYVKKQRRAYGDWNY